MPPRSATRRFVLGFALTAAACSSDNTVDNRDRTGPRVVATTPKDGAKDVDIRPDVTVQFSEAILVLKKLDEGKAEEFDYSAFTVHDAQGAKVAGFLTFNNDTVHFRAADPLAYSTKYTVEITNGVKDLFGNRGKPHTFSFTTLADTVAPHPPYALLYPTLTNQATARIEGAKDPGSAVRINGQDAGVDTAPGTFALTVNLTDGDNTFFLTAADDAGNESLESTVVIKLDRTPPASLTKCGGTGLAYHDGAAAGCWNPPSPLRWNNRNLVLAAEWSPSTGETAYFKLGGLQTAAFTTPQILFDQFQPALVGGQAVKLQAYTLDQAGNQTLAFERDFVYDDTAALAARDGRARIVTAQRDLAFTFDKEAGAVFFASLDGRAAAACATPATVCAVPLGGVADGDHVFAATATDAAGNETRLVKVITVDTVAPQVLTVPAPGAVAPANPVLHLFAGEPVTLAAGALVDAAALGCVSDATSGGTHWLLTPPQALGDGSHTVSLQVHDAAGNVRALTWSFTASAAYAAAPTAATYATPAPLGSPRAGRLVVAGMPAGLVNVVRYQNGGVPGTYTYAATVATAVTVNAEPLSVLQGEVRSYDSAGTYTTAPLPGLFNPFYPRVFTPAGTYPAVNPFSYASVGFTGSAPADFAWLMDSGYTLETTAGAVQSASAASCNEGGQVPGFPLVPFAPPWALVGRPCSTAGPGVYLIRLAAAALLSGLPAPLWRLSGEDEFGADVTAARFFGDGNLQVAVGSPRARGSAFMYASTAATAPVLVLTGDRFNSQARFGESLAFAAGHFRDAAGAPHAALAVMAPKEPAIYFFDDGIYAARNVTPAPLYRGRWSWEARCFAPRFEVFDAGDLDGDGSHELAAAQYCVLATLPGRVETSLAVFYGGAGAAAAGPVLTRFTAHLSPTPSAERPRVTPVGDLDGDGRADLAMVDRGAGSNVRLLYGTAGRTLRQSLAATEPGSTTLAWVLGGVTDADGDGRPDLILARLDLPALAFQILP
jgi:hypothetical protein